MTDTIDTSPEAVDAATHLLNNQQQLDADGTMVGVSRQALDEVLTGLKLAVKRIAELEAQPEPVVQVKPLEWQGPKPNGGRKRGRWDARGYRVVKHEDDKFVLFKNYTGMGEYETVELAITAAQDDHERRILSAITIPPQTTPLEAQISEATQERDWAAHSLAKAVASGDTRSIHAGRDRMKRATHDLMKLELAQG